MKAEYILQADLLDIIFETRNKAYGAYTLRKHYHVRLYKSFLITCLLIAVSIFFLSNPDKKLSTIVFEEPVYGNVPELRKEKPKPIEKINVEKPAPADPVKTIPENKLSATTPQLSRRIVFSATTDSLKNIPGDSPAAIAPVDVAGNGLTVKPPATSVKKTGAGTGSSNRASPVASAEVMPSYPGGIAALTAFLQKNLVNPAEVAPGDIITVKIQFIVNFDGDLKGFTIIEDGGELFNNEVLRVLKKMPAWIPGQNAGEHVSVFYSIPVKFMPAE